MSIFKRFFDIFWQGVERIDRSKRVRTVIAAPAAPSFHRRLGCRLKRPQVMSALSHFIANLIGGCGCWAGAGNSTC
jgi:hypothetical protein